MAEEQTLIDVKMPNSCATCSEKTVDVCGVHVKRWFLLLIGFIITTVVFFVLFLVYVVGLGTATSCRLTYSDKAVISESEMQTWASRDDWPLKVPSYDPWRRTCVCKGYEDTDPGLLLPEDEVLAWIAPGDLVSLSDEGKIDKLPSSFVDTYKEAYAEADHVKVCMPQKNVVDLWNINDAEGDGGHCHTTKGDGSNTVERFFLGWDGALFCCTGTAFVNVAGFSCDSCNFCVTPMSCNALGGGFVCGKAPASNNCVYDTATGLPTIVGCTPDHWV